MSLQPVMSDVHLLKKKFNLITLRPTFMLHNLLPIRVRVAEKVSEYMYMYIRTYIATPPMLKATPIV